jgi:predicted RNase H-like HicB family nuclease
MKSYVFRVVLQKDEDVWRAFIPELESKGAATWGNTKEEALSNIREVAQMVIESMLEDGESLPPRVTEIDSRWSPSLYDDGLFQASLAYPLRLVRYSFHGSQ